MLMCQKLYSSNNQNKISFNLVCLATYLPSKKEEPTPWVSYMENYRGFRLVLL